MGENRTVRSCVRPSVAGEALTSASGSPTTASGRTGSTMQGHVGAAEARARLGELAVARRPHDAVFADFVAVYYDALPADDVGEHDIDDLYAAAAAHYDLGRVRRRGVPLVRVSTPERDGDAWSATHSGVLAVTDDMPFLVDTMRMLLERHGLDIHLLVHPMLAVARDDDGALVSVGAVDTAGTEDDRTTAGRLLEAWTELEIDRVDGALADELEAELVESVADVRRVVTDFEAMRHRLQAVIEVHPALDWFDRGNLVFLGAVDVRTAEDGAVTPLPETGLGQLRAEACSADTLAKVCFPTSVGRRDTRPAIVARADTISSVFRPRARDGAHRHRPRRPGAAAPLRRAAVDGSPAGERARHPGLRRRDRRRPAPHRDDGAQPLRARRPHDAREPAPRPACWSCRPPRWPTSSPRSSACRSGAWCACSRCPSRSGCGPPCSCTSRAAGSPPSCPAQLADTVAAAYGAEQRTFESFVGASSLARVDRQRALADRRRGGRPRRPRAGDRLQSRRGPTGCGRRRRRARRDARAGDCSSAFGASSRRRTGPPWRRSGRSPTCAASARWSTAATSWPRRSATRRRGRRPASGASGCTAGARRRCCPSCCRCSTTSGCSALDERAVHVPVERTADGWPCECTYDIGVRVPDGRRARRRPRRPTSSEAFAGLVDGVVESDGFNRLVLLAGLDAREVDDAARLRQVPAPDRLRLQPVVHRGRRWPATAGSSRDLVELFHARFDPDRSGRWPTPDRGAGRGRATDRSRRSTPSPASTTTASAAVFLTLIDGHRAHELLPRPTGTLAFKLDPAADRPSCRCPRPRPRDLGVRPARRGRAPARRRHRPRRAALERPPRGLPHRGARPDEGPDGEERGDRAHRRQGRLRRQAAGRRPRRHARRGRRLLPGVHPRPARRHRQPRSTRRPTTSPPARHGRARRRRPLPRRRRRQGDGHVQRHRQRDLGRVRLLARRRVRVGRQRRVRPQGDGHHRPRGVGERAPPRPQPRARRRRRPADRRRHRRHVGRRVRQRDVALAGAAARRRVRPPPRVRRSRTPTPRRPSPNVSACSTFPAPRWADYDPALLSAGGAIYPRTQKSIDLSARGAGRARRRTGPADQPTSSSRRC